MSLQSNLTSAFTRVATEFKTVYSRMGALTDLTTTNKTSLVSAVNEVRAAAASATGINDATTTTTTTWSSSKINTQINASVPTWSTLAGKPTLSAVATSGSYADLTGTIPTSALPPLAINEVFTVATQAAMTSLTAERGDMAIRTDTGNTFVLAAEPASTLANWKEITTANAVLSVAGRTGVVTLSKTDVGLANVDNTSDASKPISTATQTALNAKAATSHTHTAAQVSDASTVGRSVLTATDAAAARTAIGAGTSSLALGSTASTAAAGNHTHVIANVTDATATGQAVVKAASAAAARTAIGAGTSSLVIGTAAGTAQDSAAVGDTEADLVAIFEAALA